MDVGDGCTAQMRNATGVGLVNSHNGKRVEMCVYHSQKYMWVIGGKALDICLPKENKEK